MGQLVDHPLDIGRHLGAAPQLLRDGRHLLPVRDLRERGAKAEGVKMQGALRNLLLVRNLRGRGSTTGFTHQDDKEHEQGQHNG